MPTRGYIAGKPVSRWEAADSDNIDIEYKNLDRPGRQSWCGDCLSGNKGLVLKALVLAVLFVLGLVLGYVIRKSTCRGDGSPASATLHVTFVRVQQVGQGVGQSPSSAGGSRFSLSLIHI